MPHKGIRIALATLELGIGICALGGGYAVTTGAFGFTQFLPLAWLEGTPFLDYAFPGLFLFIVIGGGMLLAAATIFSQRRWAVLLSATMGVILVGFEAVEAAVIDRISQAVIPPTLVQQLLMIALGVVIVGVADWLWLREYDASRTAVRAKLT
jgi:hypothetical protein